MRECQRQSLEVTELAEEGQPETVRARQAAAQHEVDDRRMRQRHAADPHQVPEFVLGLDPGGQAVSGADVHGSEA